MVGNSESWRERRRKKAVNAGVFEGRQDCANNLILSCGLPA